MRPDLQLFLHVLGAVALFGAVAAVAILGFAGRRPDGRARLAGASLRTLIFVAVPAWAVMLAFGSWTKSKEGLPGGIEWLKIGSAIAAAGIAVLLATAAIAYAWTRRPSDGRLPLALGVLATGYLAALAVAWWVMSAKVPT